MWNNEIKNHAGRLIRLLNPVANLPLCITALLSSCLLRTDGEDQVTLVLVFCFCFFEGGVFNGQSDNHYCQ